MNEMDIAFEGNGLINVFQLQSLFSNLLAHIDVNDRKIPIVYGSSPAVYTSYVIDDE